jgi:hypothetical protein
VLIVGQVTISKRELVRAVDCRRTSSRGAARRRGQLKFHTACVVVAMTAEHFRCIVETASTTPTQRINQANHSRHIQAQQAARFCPD